MAEQVWVFRGANAALVLDLGCIQIWLPTMCTSLDFFLFLAKCFSVFSFKPGEYGQCVLFPAYLWDERTTQVRIFYLSCL